MRRRKVWRVAAGYSVVGWLIIQFATTQGREIDRVTIQELRLDPVWDALRGDPRFQRMLTKFASKP